MTDLTPVTSSNIAAIGYDPSTKALTVRFHSGATHVYHEVGPEHWNRMQATQSVGKYFHNFVRNAHKSHKVEKP